MEQAKEEAGSVTSATNKLASGSTKEKNEGEDVDKDDEEEGEGEEEKALEEMDAECRVDYIHK